MNSASVPFSRVAIWGIGLIGGSLALAIKRQYPSVHVRGLGRNSQRLRQARARSMIDDFAADPATGIADRDLLILATPVHHIQSVLPGLASISSECIITDVGSTKLEICRQAWGGLSRETEFIGGHPIAGKELAGFEHADADLFRGATYVLTPRPEIESPGLPRLRGLIEAIGASPVVLSAERHDRILAWTSHLPQLVATGLAGTLEQAGEDLELLNQLSGGGLKDMTRLGASPYLVWQGILKTNAGNVRRALGCLIEQLEAIREALPDPGPAEAFERAARFLRVQDR